jgi:hypothetical protein
VGGGGESIVVVASWFTGICANGVDEFSNTELMVLSTGVDAPATTDDEEETDPAVAA